MNVCSFENEVGDWISTRLEVSKVTIIVLMERCQYILNRFLIDEADLGAYFGNSEFFFLFLGVGGGGAP